LAALYRMKIRFFPLLILAIAPGVVHALGLGKLQLESALNEPFKARIELLAATTDDINSLNVALADEAAFRHAGVPREFVLMQLRFTVKESDAGPDYILVSSTDPIREPFLNFLVEVSWSKGRLYREYTVLLDPPKYVTEQMRKKVTPPPVTTSTQVAPESRTGKAISEEEQTVIYNPEYKPSKTPPLVTTATGISQPTGPVEYKGGDYGPVVSGDTLWSIANAMRPDSSISIQQMMLALLRTNPEAFINGNINGLKRGYVLKAPDLPDIRSLEKDEAFAQAQLQNSTWEEARQAFAAAPPVRPEGAPAQPAPVEAKPVTPPEKAKEVVKEEAKPAGVETQPELRLVAPGEAGKSATQGGTTEQENAALTKELALARENLEAINLENTELKDKIKESDAIVADLKRLITLKETELANLQKQVAKKAAQPPVQKATQPAPASPATQTKPEKAPAGQKKSEPSLVSSVIDVAVGLAGQFRDYLLYIVAALGAAVALFAGAYFVQRRKKGAGQLPEGSIADFGEEPTIAIDSEDSTDMNLGAAGKQIDQEAITILPGEGSESTRMPEAPSVASSDKEVATIEAADPLEEVNVFLAYEHFDQAEEFVKNAMEKEPDNLAYHVKLLEVYYTANNKKSYEQAARVLHDKVQGKGDYWNMAVAMWQVLSPNRELFASPAAGEEAVEAPAEKEAGGIVNITGDGQATSGGLDFDLDTTGGGAGGESDTLEVAASSEPDILDVTSAISTADNEMLDVTSAVTSEDADAIEQETVEAPSEDQGLDFSLDLEGKPEEEEQAVDISEDFLQAENEAPAETAGDDETALDFSLDLEGKPEEEEQVVDISEDFLQAENEAPAETAGENEPDLEFSLDLDEPEEKDTASGQELDVPPGSGGEEPAMDVSFTASAPGDEASLTTKEEDMKDQSKSGATDQGADLLDVTSATDFNPESGEDLLDVTFASNVQPQEKDDDAKLDFELAPDQPVPGDESASTFDGIDITAATGSPGSGLDLEIESSPETEEDTYELDMDATMQIPSKRSSLSGKVEADTTLIVPRSSDGVQSDEDEIATQMDLAKAYIELGNADSAKTILDEIIAIGNDAQRQQAQELLGQIS
jgi:pilus assembly protein FimV